MQPWPVVVLAATLVSGRTLVASCESPAQPAPIAPARLTLAEQGQIMKVLCLEADPTATLAQDASGWVCRRPESADDYGGLPTEERWSWAVRGRFVAEPGEWLVSLESRCARGCLASATTVVKRVGGSWQVLAESQPTGDPCVVLTGFKDGRGRLACLFAAGPFQGFMAEGLEIDRFDGQPSGQRLLFRELGGECFLAQPPARAEHVADELKALEAGDPATDTALTVRLVVKRYAGCDANSDDPDKLAQVKAEHVLRFVRRGDDVEPDAATAALIARYGWSEAP